MSIVKPDAVISALLPCYTNQGDHSLLCFATGKTAEFTCSVETVLKQLAVAYQINLVSLRQEGRRRTGRQEYIPLPFAPELLLTPIKLRQPRLIGDGSLGYINTYLIRSIQDAPPPYESEIQLSCGQRILAYWKKINVEKQIRRSRITTVDPGESNEDRRQRLLITNILALLRTFPAM